MKEYLRDRCHIHLDYETIEVVEAVVKVTEIPMPEDDYVRGCAIRLPDDESYYTVDFYSLTDELIATRESISYDIWAALKYGTLKDGDHVSIETEGMALVNEDNEDKSWTPVFGEALCIGYSRIKYDSQSKKIIIHGVDKLKRPGDDDYFRKY